jgi:CubicO group peptidase (beta-lactamase class C family)
LVDTESYLAVLGGFPPSFQAGERFAYCNGGYVVLALVAERAGGAAFGELLHQRVCQSAGMTDTAFLRSDALPGRAALGYLHDDGLQTNVFHLPVRGSGDGGLYSTAADIHRLWDAIFAERIVSAGWVEKMTRHWSTDAEDGMSYGLGFWLSADDTTVMLHGCDPGVSFHTARRRDGAFAHTVISNTADGAWPLARALDHLVAG